MYIEPTVLNVAANFYKLIRVHDIASESTIPTRYTSEYKELLSLILFHAATVKSSTIAFEICFHNVSDTTKFYNYLSEHSSLPSYISACTLYQKYYIFYIDLQKRNHIADKMVLAMLCNRRTRIYPVGMFEFEVARQHV